MKLYSCSKCGWRGLEANFELLADKEEPYEQHESCPRCWRDHADDTPIDGLHYTEWERANMPEANRKKYTENDMNTIRALYDGCQKGCQDLRQLLDELEGVALHHRGYSPVDLDDDELFRRVKKAINAPASDNPHGWVGKHRFDAGIMAHNDLVDHHAKHHRGLEEVSGTLLGCQTVLEVCLNTASSNELKTIIRGQLDKIKEAIPA